MTTSTTSSPGPDAAADDRPSAPPTPRLDLRGLIPDVYRAMGQLEQAAHGGIEPRLAELIRIRASQINGCAFCLDMHTKDARHAGETEQRIYLLNAWRESEAFYTDKERAALALTEAITLVSSTHVPDDVFAAAAEQFEPAELAHLIAQIVAINSWNRLSITTRTAPGQYQPGQRQQ
jgi:AhpD family alkylhydroperoxidase